MRHNKRMRHNKDKHSIAGYYSLQSQDNLAELEFDTSPFPEVATHIPMPKQPSLDPKKWNSYQNGLANYRNLKNIHSYLKSNSLTNIHKLEQHIIKYGKMLQKQATLLKEQMDSDKQIY